MKRSDVNKVFSMVLCLLTALLWWGCAKEAGEQSGPAQHGGKVSATFDLVREFEEEVVSRATGSEDVNVITDVWVIQLNRAGTARLQAPVYVSTVTAAGADYKAFCDLTAQDSKICFIANTHNASAYSSVNNMTDIANITKSLTAETDLTNGGVPMSGVWEGTPTLNGISATVPLTRAIAKVTFNLSASLPSGDYYTLESITVRQVPDKLHYYRDKAQPGTPPYPALTATIDYAAQPLSGNLSLTQSFLWYIPENARGTGSGTAQTDKTAAKAPAGQDKFCTYVEISGKYYNAAKSDLAKTIYRIYLGADNVADYNVLRNKSYTVNTVIRGINNADSRFEQIRDLDYTATGNPWVFLKSEDTKNGASDKMTWPIASTLCPAGYRLPVTNEAIIMTAYTDGWEADPPFVKDGYYWTGSVYTGTAYNTVQMAGSYSGMVSNAGQSSQNYLRCVKDGGGSKTPFVTTNDAGKMLVIASDGVKSGALAPGGSGSDGLGANKVSPRFEVYDGNNSTNTSWSSWMSRSGTGTDGSQCPAGWRMPSERELSLIFLFSAQLSTPVVLGKTYWAGGRPATSAGWVITLTSNVGIMISTGTISNPGYYTRCVRDV